MKYFYKPRGTCSNKIEFEVEKGIIKSVTFDRGCEGNLIAISKLIEGKTIDEVIHKFKGIKCKSRNTSCPDQLAEALIGLKEQYLKKR